MTTKYSVVPVTETESYNPEDYYDAEYLLAIVRETEGEPQKVLPVDGGEPEDNSFGRDGSWIAPALNAAYKLGYQTCRDDYRV